MQFYKYFISRGHSAIIILALLPMLAMAKDGDFKCPEWINSKKQELPVCPEGSLVPENYPAAAVLVSDIGGEKADGNYTADVVEKVLLASGERVPMIMLAVVPETFDLVTARIDQMKISAEKKAQFKKAVLVVPGADFTWQQDYMQPTVDGRTGRVFLREVEGYGLQKAGFHKGSFLKVSDAAVKCGFAAGETLKTPKDWKNSGYMAGNIETLPGGICLLGTADFKTPEEWQNYADQFCSKDLNERIEVPTDWLHIGHTDEILKVVGNANKAAPCNFSVVVASTDKALELLGKHPDEKFFEFSNPRDKNLRDINYDRILKEHRLYGFCQKILRELIDEPVPNSSTTEKESVSFLLRSFLQNILEKSQAVTSVDLGSPYKISKACYTLTNAEILKGLTKNHDLTVIREAIEKKMVALKKDIAEKLKLKFPRCETDFIDAPYIYDGIGVYESKPGVFEISKHAQNSLLPNPANSLTVNDTIISPEPGNGAFKEFLSGEYTKRGLKSEFVDTFEYAHKSNGNLHCSTNSIHICRPAKTATTK